MATNIPVTGNFRVTCEFKRKGNWAAGWHTGIDMVCDNDTIYATCDGEVTRIEYNDKSYGHFIVIKNNADGKYHWYCHLSRIDVKVGDKVSRTSKIGVMGNTGNSTGKHLHFEIRNTSNKYADNSNPAEYMGIPNVVGEYNSADYQIQNTTVNNNVPNINVGERKKLAINTNLREAPTTDSIPHLYVANTTVEILEINVANNNGYVWDKVKIVYAKPNDYSVGYMARTENRYK